MCLWEFSWNFCDFRSIFRAFKQFLDFFWNCFALKINSEKTQILSNWAEPEGRTQPPSARRWPSRGPARGPSEPDLRPEAEVAMVPPPPLLGAGLLGVCDYLRPRARAHARPCCLRRPAQRLSMLRT
jgi:hypothetical protein